MNSFFYILLASFCACLSSLFFRKNSDSSDRPSGYLLFFYFFSFAISLVISFAELDFSNISLVMLFLGALVGVLSLSLMRVTSKALAAGPSSLTFAFLNASAVFPGTFLFFLFGEDFGFKTTYFQYLGIVLVLIGLFAGVKGKSDSRPSLQWVFYALACFFIQVFALTCIQGRCVLYDMAHINWLAATPKDDIWFVPGQFGAASLFQLIIFLREKGSLKSSEVRFGLLGGVCNLGSTLLLLMATQMAAPEEKAILFPCFAVGTIILCNLWANKLYKEKFNWLTTSLCSSGILLSLQ